MARHLFGACAVTLLLTAPALGDPITLDPNNGFIHTTAHDRSQPPYDRVEALSPLVDGTYTAMVGRARSTTTFTAQLGPSEAILRVDLHHDITAGTANFARTHSYGELAFEVIAPIAYELTGRYEGTGSNDIFYSFAELVRTGPSSETKFHEYEYEYDADSVSFSPNGQPDTSYAAYSTGSTTGTLEAGSYRLNFSYYGFDYDIGSLGNAATGRGFLQLTLGSPQVHPVPEPGTCALLALAAVALCLRQRS